MIDYEKYSLYYDMLKKAEYGFASWFSTGILDENTQLIYKEESQVLFRNFENEFLKNIHSPENKLSLTLYLEEVYYKLHLLKKLFLVNKNRYLKEKDKSVSQLFREKDKFIIFIENGYLSGEFSVILPFIRNHAKNVGVELNPYPEFGIFGNVIKNETIATERLTNMRDISANNDLDFYFNIKNIGNNEFVFDTIKYFESGKRKGLIEPLDFLNLLWKQYNFVKENFAKPHFTLIELKALQITPELQHILFGFILKMHGYPVKLLRLPNQNNALDLTLKLLEDEFLGFELHTPEKENYLRKAWDNTPIILNHQKTTNYKFTSKDFESISANNDLDFYYTNIFLTSRDDFFTYHTVKYFQSGKRQGFIEPLAFLNLLFEQLNFLNDNVDKAYSTIDALKKLPLNYELKHILFGFILKVFSFYPSIGYPSVQHATVLKLLEKEFLSFEGETPEKEFCSKDWKEEVIPIINTPTIINVPIINPKVEVTIEEQINENTKSKEQSYDSIKIAKKINPLNNSAINIPTNILILFTAYKSEIDRGIDSRQALTNVANKSTEFNGSIKSKKDQIRKIFQKYNLIEKKRQ